MPSDGGGGKGGAVFWAAGGQGVQLPPKQNPVGLRKPSLGEESNQPLELFGGKCPSASHFSGPGPGISSPKKSDEERPKARLRGHGFWATKGVFCHLGHFFPGA